MILTSKKLNRNWDLLNFETSSEKRGAYGVGVDVSGLHLVG
jgi:hypothetical protein